MAHPFASQAKASEKRRLGRLGAKAGKSFGSTSMYKASSYPSKGAGSSTPMTISGGSAKKRADRPANHFADGGFIGKGDGFGAGTKKKKKSGGKKGHSTTNIVIASPGGGGGPQAMPVPRPVPVPVPVGGGPPIARPPAAAPPPGLGGAPGLGGGPVNVNVPPPAAAPPMPAGPRPPGMAEGGTIKGSTYHNWGKGYKEGGVVKKKANGGGLGPGGMAGKGLLPGPKPFAGGAVPGTPAARPGSPGPGSPVMPMTGGRPTRPGYGMKKGGGVHEDEAEDKKLIAKMIKKSKKADGGRVGYHEDGDEVTQQPTDSSSTTSPAPVAPGATGGGKSSMKGVMDALGGVAKAVGGGSGSTPSGSGAMQAADAAKSAATAASQVAAQSGGPRNIQYAGFKPGAIPGGSKKYSFNKGGAVKAAPSSGLGRLQRIPSAKKVPSKTEV